MILYNWEVREIGLYCKIYIVYESENKIIVFFINYFVLVPVIRVMFCGVLKSQFMSLQVIKVVLIVVDWVTESQSVLNWKPFNRNKLAVLVEKTILLTQQLTGDTLLFL